MIVQQKISTNIDFLSNSLNITISGSVSKYNTQVKQHATLFIQEIKLVEKI